MYHYWLLLFPFYLAGDYSHSSLPVVRSFNDPNFLLIAAFYILLFGLLPYFVLKKYSSKYWPSLFFIYGLLTLPFLPLSNLLYYVMFEVAERVMYIPSAAFCILVSALLFLPVDNRNLSQKMNLRNFPPETLEKKKIAKSDEGGFIKKFWLLDHNRTVFIPFLIVVILFAIRCHLRNYDWRTNDSFWMTLFDRFPNNYKVLQLHIHQLVLKNDSSLNPRIETLYEKLLGLHFSDGDAYNFALHLFKNGKYEYGKEVLLRSLSQGSKDWSGERCVLPEIYRALHTYYMDLKDFSQAEKYLLLEAKSNFCHFKLPDFLVQQWKVSSLVKELCKPLSKGANASQFGVSFEEMVALLQGNLPSPKRWKSLSKGQSLYINNKHQASLEWYISQLNKFPAHLQLLSEMALILYFSQKYLDCAYIFNEVIKKDYFKPLNYQAMAMCLVKAGSFYEYDAQEILKMGTAALNYTQHMESLMEKKKKYLKTDQQ
ncbi:protein O-mannosyl-transferase TMTC3-like [Zophobas morio]|uniref:protein O-mannosyl-transferase TMTC3-like n=1 Tax=Zophobas morio TaxID=2755281 RepID=UPI0030839D8E